MDLQVVRRLRLPFLSRHVIWLLLIGWLIACQPRAPEVDHFAKAKEVAARLTAEHQKEDLSHPAYEEVAQELQLVPGDSPDKAAADEWLKQIQAARRSRLWAVTEQEGGSLPDAGQPSRTASRTTKPAKAHTGTLEGWLPDQPVNVAEIEASVRGGSSSRSGKSRATAATASSGGAHITIYTAAWCGVCKAAKSYMSQKGYPFTDRDIEKDPSAKAEMVAKVGGNVGIPVIDVGGQIMVGFDRSALDRMVRGAR